MNVRRCVTLAALVLATLGAACSDSLVGPSPATDRASLFDDVWTQFDLHYSYFELHDLDWSAIGAKYRPLALAAKSDTDFARVLGKMLAETHDLHVSITPFGAGSTMRYVSAYDTSASGYDASATIAKYVTSGFTTTGGHLRGGRVGARTGYIQIPSFTGSGWAAEMDDALTRIGDVDAIVIDLRNNFGGNKTMATHIAGRFADRQRTFGYVRLRNGPKHTDFSSDIAETVVPEGAKRFAGKVILLTNRRCMSAAEDFALALRALPQTTVVGDTTAGASGGPLVREMANGWTYQMSQWMAYTADHKLFEGVGLAPHYAVKAVASNTQAAGLVRSNQTDVVLEKAISLAK